MSIFTVPDCIKINHKTASIITYSTYRKTWMFYSGCWTGVDRAVQITASELLDVLNQKRDNNFTYVFGAV